MNALTAIHMPYAARRMRVVPFEPWHMLAVQPAAWRAMAPADAERLAEAYHRAGNAFTIINGEGRVLMCGGAVDAHAEYASLWSVYQADATRQAWAYMLRRSRHFIASLPHRRVDAAIPASDIASRHWAVACGLSHEGTLHEAAPDGGDMLIYRRARP